MKRGKQKFQTPGCPSEKTPTTHPAEDMQRRGALHNVSDIPGAAKAKVLPRNWRHCANREQEDDCL
jgi:hypothetical protein